MTSSDSYPILRADFLSSEIIREVDVSMTKDNRKMKQALSLALRVFAAILIKPIQKQRSRIEAVSHQGPSMSSFVTNTQPITKLNNRAGKSYTLHKDKRLWRVQNIHPHSVTLRKHSYLTSLPLFCVRPHFGGHEI